MHDYSAFSDDYYINMNLNTEMDLPQSRESVLHYFEQARRKFPQMRNFYNRDRAEFVLEEDKDSGAYRWTTVENKRLCSGYVNPPTAEEAFAQHRLMLDIAPYALSINTLDCESLNVMFGFDYTYRGNHNELLQTALGMTPAFERMTEIPGATLLCHEPAIQFALDSDCRVQCRLSVETRTTAYNVRTAEYPEEQLSVYFTARRYGVLEPDEQYTTAMDDLAEACVNILDNYVVENVLQPLQQTIAIQ